MFIDVTQVRQAKIRKALNITANGMGIAPKNIDFIEKFILGNSKAKLDPEKLIVVAELDTIYSKLSKISDNVYLESRNLIREYKPYFLIYLKTQQDLNKITYSLTSLYNTFNERVEYVQLENLEMNHLKSRFRYIFGKIQCKVEPDTILDIRYDEIDDNLWIHFGDGLARNIKWSKSKLKNINPKLIPFTAVVLKDMKTIGMRNKKNEIITIGGSTLRVIVDEHYRKAMDQEDQKIKFEIGVRLKNWREFKNVTQIEFGEKSGLDQSSISRIENGRHNPRLDTLRKYSNVLEIDLPLLLEGPPKK